MKSAMVEREAGDAAAERGLLVEGIRRFPYFWKLHLMLGQLEERLGGWEGLGIVDQCGWFGCIAC
jgi:hypothetical protein